MIIFDDHKASFRELRKLHEAGRLNQHAERLWQPRKPREELYDLEKDPHELNNLASDSSLSHVKQELSEVLKSWILEHRDSGFLPEAEYQIRDAAKGLTPYDVVQSPDHFSLADTLDAAWLVGDSSVSIDRVLAGLKHEEAGVRYWSAMGLQAREKWTPSDRQKATQPDIWR